MRPVLFLLACLFYTISGSSQTLYPVDSASQVSFRIKNLGFYTTGSLSGLTGTIRFVSDAPDSCLFDVQLNANTVNTGVEMRDNHLKATAYLDAKNYPHIRFLSVKVAPTKKNGTLFVSGKLTMKGITKEISFPFTATAMENGYQFTGSFKINRRDFNVGEGGTIGNELTVLLKVEARKR